MSRNLSLRDNFSGTIIGINGDNGGVTKVPQLVLVRVQTLSKNDNININYGRSNAIFNLLRIVIQKKQFSSKSEASSYQTSLLHK
jgi:hypothetical protein